MNRRRWTLLATAVAGAAALVVLHVFGVGDSGSRKADVCSPGQSNRLPCLEARYVRLVRIGGPEQALRAFRADYDRSALVRAECHGLTHLIGRAAGRRYGEVTGAYRRGDRFCGSGYYHGAVEAIVSGPARAEALSRPSGICSGLRRRSRRSVDHLNCAHGLGHGFMATRANDVPASLKICDRLDEVWERGNCYAGVFMQNVMAEDDPRNTSRYLDPDRPLHPCPALPDRYRARCYERQILYALERYRGDFRTVFDLCSSIAAGQRANCVRKLGGAAAELSISSQAGVPAQVAATARVCELAPDGRARVHCAEGASGQFVYYFDGTAEAKAFCQALGSLQRACIQGAEDLYGRRQ